MGFEKPTPIQERAIPVILENRDVIACAQTGTGKTAAFLLPVINKIIKEHTETVNALIIVPTRELAIQIDEALQGFSYFTPISAIAIYGGTNGISYEQEKKALTQGANIIIATPGRLLAHLNQGYVKFNTVKHLILDEADRMLDMGFSDDLNRIISFLPEERQTLMFSATMPPKIRALAGKVLKQPVEINIAVSKPAAGVLQAAYLVPNEKKIQLIKHLLAGKNLKSILIFSSTKSKVWRPLDRRSLAASNTFFRSATPENTADICSKCNSVASARSRATVVLPVPGGPQKISEPSVRVSSMRVSAPSGPRM